jgi:site-specific DNA-adenine methylase
MKDDGKLDDKIICVATNDPRYLHTADITDIEDHYRSEIAHFFQVYKDLEGKKVEILGWKSAKEAKHFEKILAWQKNVNISHKKRKFLKIQKIVRNVKKNISQL